MTKYLTLLALALLMVACAHDEKEEEQKPPPPPEKTMQLPGAEGAFVTELDSTKVPVHIGVGFKGHEPGNPILLYVEGKEYPISALYDYIGKKRTALTAHSGYDITWVLEMDERLPFKVFSDLKSELRYWGALHVHLVQRNGKGIKTRYPDMTHEEQARYIGMRKEALPSEEWQYPEVDTSLAVEMPKQLPKPGAGFKETWKASDILGMLKKERTPIIQVDGNDGIVLNGEPVGVAQLVEKCMAVIEEHNVKAVLFLDTDEKATYGGHIAAYAASKESYERVWDKASMGKYGKPYHQLTREERNEVIKKYPFVLAEVSPMDFEFEGRPQ